MNMGGPRLAVALGVVLLLLGFATGTWNPSTPVHGGSITCASVIDLARLPFNELGAGPSKVVKTRGPDSRRHDAACARATLPLRRITWTALAAGALMGLAGWTAMRERDSVPRAGESVPSDPTPAGGRS
jgi:hypothetical protein